MPASLVQAWVKQNITSQNRTPPSPRHGHHPSSRRGRNSSNLPRTSHPRTLTPTSHDRQHSDYSEVHVHTSIRRTSQMVGSCSVPTAFYFRPLHVLYLSSILFYFRLARLLGGVLFRAYTRGYGLTKSALATHTSVNSTHPHTHTRTHNTYTHNHTFANTRKTKSTFLFSNVMINGHKVGIWMVSFGILPPLCCRTAFFWVYPSARDKKQLDERRSKQSRMQWTKTLLTFLVPPLLC